MCALSARGAGLRFLVNAIATNRTLNQLPDSIFDSTLKYVDAPVTLDKRDANGYSGEGGCGAGARGPALLLAWWGH